MEYKNIGVIGAGAWGTSMAIHLANHGHDVSLWSFEADVIAQVNEFHRNRYLEDIELPPYIEAVSSLFDVLNNCNVIFWAVPVQHIRSVINKELDDISKIKTPHLNINLSKGIELDTKRFPLDILREYMSEYDTFASVSGPSFATPFAMGLPTVLVAAAKSEVISQDIQKLLQAGNLRVYTSVDPVGVQLAGALKNVYAIASGIADGMRLGDNARAAIITRALVELTRLGTAMGASSETLAGAAGIGDLILTCTSNQSRNYTLGYKIGCGEKPIDIVKSTQKAVEGYYTAKAMISISRALGIDTPIAKAVFDILYNDLSAQSALEILISRSPKPEWY